MAINNPYLRRHVLAEKFLNSLRMFAFGHGSSCRGLYSSEDFFSTRKQKAKWGHLQHWMEVTGP
jgi:hypothetical protein